MKIILVSGLPGSGKSTWIKKDSEKYFLNKYCIIDFDCYQGKSTIKEAIENSLRYSHRPVNTIYCDGLFLTNADRINILNELITYIGQYPIMGNIDTIEIHEWKEDRDFCLRNDKFRGRSQLSEITIMNASFEKTNTDTIYSELKGKINNIKLIEHDVPHTSIEESLEATYDSEYIQSESWCGGGTWANCWGSEGTVSAEPAVEFTQFDELLESLCPDITFLQYKNIYNRCVETEEFYEHDYYGGSTTNYRYKCNIHKLVECLKEKNLI